MAVWSDVTWKQAVASGRLRCDPWRPEDLTPNGLDLRIGSVLVGDHPAPLTAGKVTVPPMARFVVGTAEVVSLPDDAAGSLWVRSSYARRGVLASFGKVDAGFSGNLTVAAFHSGSQALELAVGDRFCQLVLEDLTTAAELPYAKRSGTYQNQRGITLGRPT